MGRLLPWAEFGPLGEQVSNGLETAHVNHGLLTGIKKITVYYGIESPWAFTWAGLLWHTKILWAFTWAGPLWPAKSCGPLAGPAHYGSQNFVGL